MICLLFTHVPLLEDFTSCLWRKMPHRLNTESVTLQKVGELMFKDWPHAQIWFQNVHISLFQRTSQWSQVIVQGDVWMGPKGKDSSSTLSNLPGNIRFIEFYYSKMRKLVMITPLQKQTKHIYNSPQSLHIDAGKPRKCRVSQWTWNDKQAKQ